METHSKYFFANEIIPPLDNAIRPIIIADSFSTPSNIGSVIRLAANVGALKVIVLNSDNLRESKIKKTAGAALQHVEVIFTITDRLLEYVPKDYSLIAIETVETAKSIFEALPQKIAFVLGNEKFGVSDNVLSLCDASRFIPMAGRIKSMNVSHAATVSIFEWYRQQINL
nr:TrmH family RNA methyltransferase [uncultured Carboxylicivirga sp.]